MNRIIVFVFFIASIGVNSQEINMKMGLFGYKFSQSGERLSWKELQNEMKSNTKAFEFIKKAKSQNTISSILSFAGGGLIGIPLGASTSGKDPNWTLAYIGGAMVIVALPIAISASKNAKKGIGLHNQSLQQSTSYKFNPELHIVVNGKGLGLALNF